MNEQRIHAYLNLINQLFSCNRGDETRILQENRELLDQGLIEVMIAVARQLEEEGRENEARWLISIAQQLAEALGLLGEGTKATANNPQDYLNFLMEVLEKVAKNPNPQVIYPFLAKNLDKLDDNLIEVLESWAKNTIAFLKAEDAEYIAAFIYNFSNLIGQFPLGNIANNLEIAITGYQIALTIFTFDTFPQDWAMTQNNLAIVYRKRIRGDKAENIEKAITAYNEGLKVLTFDAFPQDWAMIQDNLGNAYSERIRGDKAENLEQAIAASTAALKVLTFDTYPQDWAMTKNNLAATYSERLRGDKAENLERAIATCTEVLEVLTFGAFPQEWAMIKNNLGKIYRERIRGDKAENIEQAITASTEVLKVYTFNAFPQYWAFTQSNLATAYFERIRGDKAENLERAIAACTAALKVYTFNAYPQEWAATQNILATAYFERIRGDKAENLERAIAASTEALKVYTLDTFPQEWAATQSILATAYFERIREDKAENLERAIAASTEALKVYTFESFSQQWASIQNSLGNAYLYRIRGDKGENLEMAITACKEALKVYTFENFSQQWASIQNSLGGAYLYRIRGDKAENLEMAIAAYKEALKVGTFDALPKYWAITMNNLAQAYCKRIRGDKAENLEKAITVCQEALKVRTFETFPQDWAMTQTNLGNAYSDRIRGDKADNLEMAITHHQETLKVYTFETFPQEWAITQNNLGGAYSDRIRGDKADNLEMAITYCKEALKVYTFEAFPQEWAMMQSNLGIAYWNRIKGERADNLEMAITYYKEALKVRTLDTFPYEWARTQHNLGTVYGDRIRGERADNLEMAITYLRESLKVRTFDAFPYDWAVTQNNLGVDYANRIKGEKADNLEMAIASYHNALKIRTKENDPLNCLQTAHNLANLHYNEKQWQPATEAYHIAIEAIENARLEALNPHSRQEVLSNAIDVFHSIVQAHLNLNQPEKALEYIERSKGRNLVELMTQKNLQPQGVSQEIIDQLNELKQKVVNEQIRLQHQSMKQNLRGSDNLTPYVQDHSYLKEYQQELDDFIEREIKPIDPIFSLTQKVEPIPFTDIQALTDAETCILQWYITGEKILAFVVSVDGDIKVWESSEDGRNQLIDTISNYLNLYYSKNDKKEWRKQLSNLLQTFADTLHINDILALIPDTCKRLIIIPHRYLHILPIHALPIEDNHILQDKYNVQYAPSCQLLQIAQQRQLYELTNLFAIQNPQNNLLFTDLEVEIIKNRFAKSEVLAKQNATETAIKTHQNFPLANCIHFSCHGKFDPNNPLESALILTQEKTDQEDGYLTLGEIFELNFKNCRLVTLSACETGLIDLNSISDEYIGLPSGFLFAGSPSVVSSLWTVNDLSTAFLMMKFYETLPQNPKKGEIAVTLKNAQKWLQTLTLEQFEQELERFQPQLEEIMNKLGGGKRSIFNESIKQIRQRQPYPFENPYYWAGFIATGF